MSEAQKEAERRWPGEYPTYVDFGGKVRVRRSAFVAGAEWARTREITDAEVEAAAREIQDALLGHDLTDAPIYLAARLALEAAREVRA